MVQGVMTKETPVNRGHKGKGLYICHRYGCTFSNEAMCRGRAENGDGTCQSCAGVKGKKKPVAMRGRKPAVRKTVSSR